MFDRARADGVPPQSCYFDEGRSRWVLFYELPAEQRAEILNPSLWDEIEAQRWSGAPTRIDVGLGPTPLHPAVLAALTHRGFSEGHSRWSLRRRSLGRLTPT